MVGKKVVILGSGDIGLIMARRLTLEGAQVKVVSEIMPYSSGLKRNIVQCLDDFNIPLKLSHTVTRVHGKTRVSGVTISKVDSKRQPIIGTEEYYDCDTLLLNCGLIPENELSKKASIILDCKTGGAEVNNSLETSLSGVFSCGNALHVNDLVDYVSEEATRAGKSAAEYIKHKKVNGCISKIVVRGECGVRYTVPHSINTFETDDRIIIRFRVDDVYKEKSICIFYDGKENKRIKKRIMVLGEMQEITIMRESIEDSVNTIVLRVDE